MTELILSSVVVKLLPSIVVSHDRPNMLRIRPASFDPAPFDIVLTTHRMFIAQSVFRSLLSVNWGGLTASGGRPSSSN